MFTFIGGLTGRIQSAGLRRIIELAIFVAAILLLLWVTSHIKACNYDKGNAQYQQEKAAWAGERARLLGIAEEKERRVAELEPQLQAFKAAAAENKRVDAQLVQQIEQTAKESAHAEENAQVPVDCRVRAERICNLFRASDAHFNCQPLYDQCNQPRR